MSASTPVALSLTGLWGTPFLHIFWPRDARMSEISHKDCSDVGKAICQSLAEIYELMAELALW
jgi:hypothetical protein